MQKEINSAAMKIAFIRNEYDPYGGAERFTELLVDLLAKRGAEIHIFAHRWTDSTETKIHFHRVRSLRWLSLFRHASFVHFVGRSIQKENFDLVQSNERTLCQDVYRAGDGVHARWLEIRATHQGFFRRLSVQINPFHRYLLWLERRLFEHPQLKAVIAISDMVRKEIIDRFQIPAERVHTIYNGVDLDRFSPENRLRIGSQFRHENEVGAETPVVLFVGSGFERKGLKNLIEGMSQAGNRAHLWVVGKGKTNRYRKFVKQLDLEARITFWGPQSDVVRFYAAADVFVLPTLYEPFGNVVLEALASGLPVITMRQCGAAEIIDHGKEGFIISSSHAVGELADYLGILYNSEHRRSMSVNARKKAEHFPIKRTIDEMQHLYNKILKDIEKAL